MDDDKSGNRQLAEQEKSLIWMMRYEIRDNYDHALPLLLNAVKWDNHIDVAKVCFIDGNTCKLVTVLTWSWFM